MASRSGRSRRGRRLHALGERASVEGQQALAVLEAGPHEAARDEIDGLCRPAHEYDEGTLTRILAESNVIDMKVTRGGLPLLVILKKELPDSSEE